jgi:hypothetical protein
LKPMPLKRRRPGRPKIGEGGRTGEFVGFRCPATLKEDIEKAAAAAGRSISTECQVRIGESFTIWRALGEGLQFSDERTCGKKGAVALRVLRRILRSSPILCGMDVEDDWFSDPTAFSVFERQVAQFLLRSKPPGESKPITGESPENRIDRLLVAERMIEPPEEWKEEIGQ